MLSLWGLCEGRASGRWPWLSASCWASLFLLTLCLLSLFVIVAISLKGEGFWLSLHVLCYPMWQSNLVWYIPTFRCFANTKQTKRHDSVHLYQLLRTTSCSTLTSLNLSNSVVFPPALFCPAWLVPSGLCPPVLSLSSSSLSYPVLPSPPLSSWASQPFQPFSALHNHLHGAHYDPDHNCLAQSTLSHLHGPVHPNSVHFSLSHTIPAKLG